MNSLSLVLGANGHLGNNLVRELLKEGHTVRASVRNLSNKAPKVPYAMMLMAAHLMQLKSKITKKQPMMMPYLVKSFYKADKRYDTSKAIRDLGFNPRPQIEVIKEKMESLKENTV